MIPASGHRAPRRDPSITPTSTNIFSRATAQLGRTPSKKEWLVAEQPYLQRKFSRSTEKDIGKEPPDVVRPPSRPGYSRMHTSPIDAHTSKRSIDATNGQTPVLKESRSSDGNMIAAPFGNNLRKDTMSRNAAAGYAPIDMSSIGLNAGLPATTTPLLQTGTTNPNITYQHIHDMAAKRISTLDYLRKAHEGRVYWFNTVHFSRTDLSRLPSLQQSKLARRASNYMLLGLSIPGVIDIFANGPNPTPYELIRALHDLLSEFERYQEKHPADASSNALARARIPQMFKRSTHSTKGRRTSSANEIGLPMQASFNSSSVDTSSIAASTTSDNTSISFGSTTSGTTGFSQTTTATSTSIPSSFFDPSLGSDDFSYLLTPPLPFDPDFYETFATLCDVMIDAYTRVIQLVSTPALCTVQLGEWFGKMDSRLRKVIVGGIVREFEEASRASAKSEVAGVGRVVLGGLMAQ